jgi:cytochrome P450
MSTPQELIARDPYAFYAAMRNGPRKLPFGPIEIWMLTRYDEVAAAFKRPEQFSSIAFRETRPDANFAHLPKEKLRELIAVMLPEVPTVINSDPPGHGRYRGILNRGFTPREMGKLEGRIRQITTELVDDILARGGATDLVRDLTVPLPVTVIAELLGVDRARHADFKRWSDAFVKTVQRVERGDEPGEHQARRDGSIDPMLESMREFNAYFAAEIERRRSDPSDDLISQLVHADTAEGRLSPLELLAFVRLLLVAGNETTTNLIGNAVLALLQHPDELARLSATPELVADAVEEALRYDPPVQGLLRATTGEMELGGETIPAGARVILMMGAANRDPARWSEPDRFDLARDTTGHLGFGFGIHFCLGSHLARLESRVALEAIVTRLANLRLAGPVTRTANPILRGPATLPLAFEAR